MDEAGLCIFGEVLFDHFPDGSRVLGGAPFNVAWHLQAFGQSPRFISRVGEDAEGDAVRLAMADWGMDTGLLQRDSGRPTGRVSVALVDGEPSYDIVEPVAYDAIDADDLQACRCRLLYHGSLALRHAASRRALQVLKEHGPRTIFVDVNLRPPWWDRESLLAALADAHWVKLNQEELDLLSPELAGKPDQAASFMRAHRLEGLIVTRGDKGALALSDSGEQVSVEPRAAHEVVDTVGAGDAFASLVILGLLRGWPLADTLNRAQDFASRVVGNRGATIREPEVYRHLLREWSTTD